MAICTFFGHRDYDYIPYAEHIEQIIRGLIESEGVDEFFSGNRGNFDELCSRTVWVLKNEYPNIQSRLALAYLPRVVRLPPYFDSAKYFLSGKVTPKAAIPRTNECLVDCADFIVSGVERDQGGAYNAILYAEHKGKKIISIFD